MQINALPKPGYCCRTMCATARHMQTCIRFGLCSFSFLSFSLSLFSSQHLFFLFLLSTNLFSPLSLLLLYFILSAYYLHMLSVNRLMENTFLLTTGALSLVSSMSLLSLPRIGTA